jgi:hypothetical protein
LEIVLPAVDSAAALAEITLALAWDDEAAPAIELPLAAWFGARHALASFETWPMAVRASGEMVTLRTTLPMPFAQRARLTLRNEGAHARALHLRIGGTPAVPSRSWGRLRTSWAVRTDPAEGERFVIADLSGPGKYVGTILYMKGRRAPNIPAGSEPLSFLEGDERVEADGEIGLGIGTEDCLGGGWYFIDGRFDSPFAALIDKQSDPAGDTGQISAVRWNILSDAVNFSRSFRLSLEYGANIPATAIEYAAVGFYYQ